MPSDFVPPPGRRDSVARFAWVTLGFFILVVLWGAVVRATGSGGGCGSNWPLCNGYVNPLHHPRVATVIEFAHRQSTAVATCLVAVLTVWTFRVTPPDHRARKAAIWTVFFLVVEALLGAALVLRHWVENNDSTGRVIAQAIHFTNTLLLMAALALTAWFLRSDDRDPHVGPGEAPRSSSLLAPVLAIVSTIVVGATGALAALADTLFPSPTLSAGFAQDFATHAPALIRMRWMHPAAAVVGLCCVVWMVRIAGLKSSLSRTVLGLLALQFLLGIADVLLLAPPWMQLLHLLGADLYWIALVMLSGTMVWPSTTLVLQSTDTRTPSAILAELN
jgi:cytochrome c oxidase assembly protein subunit 15